MVVLVIHFLLNGDFEASCSVISIRVEALQHILCV